MQPETLPTNSQTPSMIQTYNPYFSQLSLPPASFQGMPVRNDVDDQGMGHSGVQMRRRPIRGTQHLPTPQFLGNHPVDAQMQNFPTQVPHASIPQGQTHIFQNSTANTQSQNIRVPQGQTMQRPCAQRPQNQNQGMGGALNQNLRYLHSLPNLPPQNPENQPPNLNAQSQGTGPSRALGEGFHVPRTKVYNTDMPDQNSQSSIVADQGLNENIYFPLHGFPGVRIAEQHPGLTQSTRNFRPQQEQPQQQQSNLQVSETQHQEMNPQNKFQSQDSEPHMNQDLILPDIGPSQLPNLYEIGHDYGGNDSNHSNLGNSGNDNILAGMYMHTNTQADTQARSQQHVENTQANQSTLPSAVMTTQPQEATAAEAGSECQRQSIFDIDTETYDALMGVGRGYTLDTNDHNLDISDSEILNLLTMNTAGDQLNNYSNHHGNEDSSNRQDIGKAPLEEGQGQDQDQDQGNPPFGFHSEIDWYGGSEDGLFWVSSPPFFYFVSYIIYKKRSIDYHVNTKFR